MSPTPRSPLGERTPTTVRFGCLSHANAGRLVLLGLLIPAASVGPLSSTYHKPATHAAASSEEESIPRPALVERDSSTWRQRQEELERLGADRWQAEGYRGQGVKVAILDTGFRGYRSFLGTVLPRRVPVRSFRTDHNLEARNSQHGILCGEVIHAIAPDAQLMFANWDLDQPQEFLDAVRWARSQGARVISCSVVTPSWSDGDGDGEIHRDLANLLGSGSAPGDMLCFASAGNTTERHWGGVFNGATPGFHQWRPHEIDNLVTPWGKDLVSVQLYAHPGSGYELLVSDANTSDLVGEGYTDTHHGDWTSAVVRFLPQENHGYLVRVRLTDGAGGAFHLTSMESSLGYTTSRGSVCFPGDGPEVIAMGAVDDTKHRVWYSACGPNSHQTKPDFVATIPFPSLWRARPFAGTSAAAPQGAGLAALLWSRHQDWSATQIRAALRRSAEDLYSPGPDCETGYGLIRLPRD
jgi:Subtilase family